jgi:methionyl-tRNA formyltransferase
MINQPQHHNNLENYSHDISIIFFGTDDFSLAALSKLTEAGYNITAVVTKPDSKKGRGHKMEMSATKKFAISNNIEVWQPINLSDINNNITALGTNHIGILVSYGQIIPKSTIDLFELGIINVHPSLLPIYRGPSPIESAIVSGDSQTGVSIIKLSPKMDAGPIYGQTIYKLSGHETTPDLRKALADVGAATLLSLLPSIINGSIKPTKQSENKSTFCKLLDKNDSWLIPEQITAIMAERLVRAHLDFPKTKIDINGHTAIITKSHVSDEQTTILDIKCSDNKYLSIDELIAPSGRTMSDTDFINGYFK